MSTHAPSSPLRWLPDGPARGSAVLLHGVAALAATWWRIGPGLASHGWEVMALDLPGHGQMPRLHRPLDLDVLVAGVVDRLPRRVDLLIGHSLGAIVALEIAHRHRDAVGAIVLEDPPGPATADPMLVAERIAADARTVQIDRDQLVRRERAGNPRWTPEDVEYAVDGIAALDAPAVAAGLRGPLRWDPVRLLSLIDVPALVVAAPDAPGRFTDDAGSALRGDDRAAVRTAIADDRFVVLNGRHCLHRDLPERWLDVVAGFADSATAGPPHVSRNQDRRS
jgi:pimeloyl-ACP methyl ester carboxylesterase